MKIPLVFYRVGNIHADFKEPFVLAFNALVRKLLSLERGGFTLWQKGRKVGKSPTIKPLFCVYF
ncbi:hypothetical protein [Helicobacter pylori]|uniref:hypothetical protein n=1 Tax=Helicobacter pylori TaxID=210 RepID=UPI000571A295|nr:hypothetical protein [Helicobacter pylori]WRC28429.1 hypothetical protein KVE89_00540 [Helicobacter pylori]WRC33896.1 hypothetical protein KVD89_00690 [Helicobacter pylori]WRE04184.1 hypothetical protein KVF09_00705 [Helicobacter pylori]